jgi:hypothetical protein
MNKPAKNRKTLSRLVLFNVLILSSLYAQAGATDKIKKVLGNDTDFMFIFGIIGIMFVVCILLYLVGRYFMKKEEAKQAARPKPTPSMHAQQRRKARRR